MNHSAIILTPVEHADAIRALSEQISAETGEDLHLGLTAEASADGTAPASHYGCRTWARQSSVDLLASLKANDDSPAVQATIVDTRPDEPGVARQHWLDALAANGLQPVIAEPDTL